MSETGTGTLVAMGGGGFSMEPDNPRLDDFVLSLVARDRPRICFVPTASADSASYLVRFYRAFSGKAIATDLTFTDAATLPRHPSTTAGLAEFVAGQDIIYVGGGNTANLLAIWRAHGLDRLLLQAWQRGAVLCGISAGMICWFRDGLTDSFGALAPLGDGLGFIDAVACPHYDSEPGRAAAFRSMISADMPLGYAADDGAALCFRGTEYAGAVCSRKDARVHRLASVGGRLQEERLSTRFLR